MWVMGLGAPGPVFDVRTMAVRARWRRIPGVLLRLASIMTTPENRREKRN